jgi:outer membrane protein OmpA-like peptidoglycan-associated protein
MTWAACRRISSYLIVGCAFVAATPTAEAQDTTFSLDRLRHGGAPDDGVGVWRPELSETPRFYTELALGFALNPFRIENHIEDDVQRRQLASVSGAPVRAQFGGYLDVGIELFQRFGVQIMLPVTFYQTGNTTRSTGVPAAVDAVDLAPAAAGDIRFDFRGVPIRTDDGFFKLGANAMIFAPSGNDLSFTGDKSTSGGFGIAPELDWKDFILTLNAGAHFRPDSGVNDFSVSHEFIYGLAAFIPLREDRVRLGAELFGSVMMAGEDAGKVSTTPLEWMVEGRFALDDKKRFWLNGWGGTRLTPGYAPDFRTGVSVGYWFPLVDTDPPAPEKKPVEPLQTNVDTDKDGYPDDIDLCPTNPEDGKPPYTTDGCPAPPDRDGDGFPDSKDKCPDEPEDKDGIDDKDGCPEDDADKDNIPDAEDACPKEPGEKSDEKDKNGCPKFIRRIEGSNEIQVLKKVEFETGSAKLRQDSFVILDEVYRLLVANPEITLLSVEGHTDSVGTDTSNLLLSKNRAKSCLDYLVQKGIPTSRLTSDGFGETKPIDSNDTSDGRSKNRRTEFHIRGQSVPGTDGATPGSNEPVPGQ